MPVAGSSPAKESPRTAGGRLGRAGLAIAGGLLLALLLVVLYLGATGRGQAVAAEPTKPAASLPVPPTQIGMVLGGIVEWGTEDVFVDIVQSRGLIVVASEQYKPLPASFRDATGHPVHIPHGMQLAVALRGRNSTVGAVDCVMSPGWRLDIIGDGRKTGSDQRFRLTMPIGTGVTGATILRMEPTGAFADLTTMSCRAVDAPQGAVFLPVFLDNLRPFRVIRFMDWMSTNNSGPRNWATRPTPASFAQLGGVAVEHMVALANTLKADPWFNMPIDASPDYYRAFATYVRDNLSPDQKVYVELSNEVWNTAFKQGRDAVERGKSAYPGPPDPKPADYYYGDRLRPMMAIWSEVFAGQSSRLVRVASSQTWAQRAEDVLSHNQTWRSVDMLATAPYFGSDGLEVNTTDQKTRVDALFASGPKAVDDQIRSALATKAIAAKYGLRYGTYEGGPGYFNGAPATQAQLNELARDPRMYDLYTLFLERWRKEVGGLFVAFDSVGQFGQSGAWGHREYSGQPLSEAPKMRALVNFVERNGLDK